MMNNKVYKLKNWPFTKGEQAQLIWISSPFKYEKKSMIYAYFRANSKKGYKHRAKLLFNKTI